jgi:hypothetical protein
MKLLNLPLRQGLHALGVIAVCSLLGAGSGVAQANYGRFLKDPANSSIVQAYGNAGGANPAAPITFDQVVDCPDCGQVGTIKFDYDTYTGKPGNSDGGAALSGGFYLGAGVTLAPGHTLGWVQMVVATRAGANDWGINTANPATFPDATPADPRYPFTTTAAVPPNPPGAPTLGFQDFPGRNFAGGAQSWLAELALVCFTAPDQNGVVQAYVIDSFLWGFGVTVAPNGITADPPSLWGPATATFLNIMNDYYDGTPPSPPADNTIVSAKYTFQNGCDDCFVKAVPEPEVYAMLLSGLAVLAFAARRRR